MTSSKIKSIFHCTLTRSIWVGIAFCATFIALVGLGAIAEDSNTAAFILAHFAGKALILLFVFFAAKFPLLFLIKGVAISSGTSALLWREAINNKTSSLNNQLTTFTQKKHSVANLCEIANDSGTTRYINQKLNSFELY